MKRHELCPIVRSRGQMLLLSCTDLVGCNRPHRRRLSTSRGLRGAAGVKEKPRAHFASDGLEVAHLGYPSGYVKEDLDLCV